MMPVRERAAEHDARRRRGDQRGARRQTPLDGPERPPALGARPAAAARQQIVEPLRLKILEALPLELRLADHDVPAAPRVIGMQPLERLLAAADPVAVRHERVVAHREVRPAPVGQRKRAEPVRRRLTPAVVERALQRDRARHHRAERQMPGREAVARVRVARRRDAAIDAQHHQVELQFLRELDRFGAQLVAPRQRLPEQAADETLAADLNHLRAHRRLRQAPPRCVTGVIRITITSRARCAS